jgi:hypothetical protein
LKSKKIEREETGHKYNLSRKKLDEIIARSKTLKVVEETPLNMDLANF